MNTNTSTTSEQVVQRLQSLKQKLGDHPQSRELGSEIDAIANSVRQIGPSSSQGQESGSKKG